MTLLDVALNTRRDRFSLANGMASRVLQSRSQRRTADELPAEPHMLERRAVAGFATYANPITLIRARC